VSQFIQELPCLGSSSEGSDCCDWSTEGQSQLHAHVFLIWEGLNHDQPSGMIKSGGSDPLKMICMFLVISKAVCVSGNLIC
jgi:hypothetical protein